MPRWNVLVVASLIGLTFAFPAVAQWKWRDKGGHTQYSDLPPPAGTPEQDILQRPTASSLARRATGPAPAAPASAASGAPLLAPRGSEPELDARRKKVEQEAADKKAAEDGKVAAAKAENCTRAKAQMRTIDSGVRMTRTNEKGEREFLDDAARAAEAKRTRDAMASDCK